MNKTLILPVALLVMVAGCGKRNKADRKHAKNAEVHTQVDIPTAEDGIRSFFDADAEAFQLINDLDDAEAVSNSTASNEAAPIVDDYGWDDQDSNNAQSFKTVYFDFDQYTVRKDQEENLKQNIALAKKMIEESKFFGEQATAPKIIIDGHACNSAGSRVYNLALSEKRAKVLADRFVEAGIERNMIKIVGRGSEIPAVVDGKAVVGSKDDQAPNRRDELHIMYA